VADVTFDVLARSKATGFDETNRKILEQSAVAKKAGEDSQKQYSALVTSAAALASTLGPLGAVAGVAMAGVAASAGVGLLAFQGLKKEWQQGTLQATALGKQINTLGDNITGLEGTAAHGVAPGLTAGLKSINGLMPAINNEVKVLSGELGVVAGNTGAAVVGLFHQLAPALEGVGASLAADTGKFKQWATSSQSVANFAALGQTELPVVVGTLTNLAVVSGHVVEALTPLGTSTLRAVQVFSGALRAIPVGTLTAALPLLTGAFVGGRLGGQASQGLEKFASKLGTVGATGSGTAKIMGGLGKVISNLGPYGIVAGAGLAAVGTFMGFADTKAAHFRAEVNKVTEALQNGTQAQAAWVAAQNTGADAATKLGISQRDVVAQIQAGQKATSSYKGSVEELKEQQTALRLQLFQQQQQFGGNSKEALATAAALQDVTNQIGVLTGKTVEAGKQFAAAKKQLADWGKSTGDVALQSEIATGSYTKNAAALFATQNAYLQGKLAADQFKTSTEANTVAMQLENNAAGLLNQSLQKLGGNNLGVAQSADTAAAAVNTATKTLKQNNDTIKGNTDKAIQNRQALQGAAAAAIQHGQAVAQQTGSTVKATAAINTDRKALEDNLRSQGLLTKGVQAYIDQLFKIPASKKTQVDLRDAAALAAAKRYKAEIDAIKTQVTVTIQTSIDQRSLQALKNTPGANLPSTQVPFVPTGGRVEQRAVGGPVNYGKVYVVGEYGPELFLPPSSGTIVPPNTGGGNRTGGFGAATTYNITINGVIGDKRAVAVAARAAIRESLRAEGKTAAAAMF